MTGPIATSTQSRSLAIAYLLWLLLGGFGVHRFYLGHTRSGLYMLGLCILSSILMVVAVGLLGYIALAIWWVADAFLMPSLLRSAPAR